MSDLFENEEETQGIIYLRATVEAGKKVCVLTGRRFEAWFPLGFFLEGDHKKPVAQSVALERGFTMHDDEFVKLANQVDIYRNFARAGLIKEEAVDNNREKIRSG